MTSIGTDYAAHVHSLLDATLKQPTGSSVPSPGNQPFPPLSTNAPMLGASFPNAFMPQHPLPLLPLPSMPMFGTPTPSSTPSSTAPKMWFHVLILLAGIGIGLGIAILWIRVQQKKSNQPKTK